MELNAFHIIPILGRKTDVPQDDMTLFQFVGETVALTHDVGGVNFDLARKRNACTKAFGYSEWSNTATAQATKCLGLFDLYDGTNRDHIYCDNGKVYAYDASNDPADVSAAGVTLANDDADLYCIIRVGSYVVIADRAEHTPYAWKNGDANAAKLIHQWTEYKFRYLVYFMNRIVGVYSDQTNGDIDIRYSNALPTPTTACYFESSDAAGDYQLWIPNDDPATGVMKMGQDRCYIYSNNSIHQLFYTQYYTKPYTCSTIVQGQGSVNHHSIVNLGDRHLFFNENYGFCEYTGGINVTPISDDIETDMQHIESTNYNRIVGKFIPLQNKVVWTVPSQSKLYVLNLKTKQWEVLDRQMRYVDAWNVYVNYTWNQLVAEVGSYWDGANTWAYYASQRPRLVYSNTNGKLYTHSSESIDGTNLVAYRVEPILDFGNKYRKDTIHEIWLNIDYSSNFSIDVYWRSGNTVGEVTNAGWELLGLVSCNSPSKPVLYIRKTARLHQLKWGTDEARQPFMISGITVKWLPESEN